MWSQKPRGLSQPRIPAGSQGRPPKGQTLTLLVPTAEHVEGFSPQDDLLGDDPIAVHVSFLRDVGLAQVLRGSPQVCAFSIEIARLRQG